MSKKKVNISKPEVHKDLEGLNIQINEFGEIVTNFKVDVINEFLNENVEDKKLQDKKTEVSIEES